MFKPILGGSNQFWRGSAPSSPPLWRRHYQHDIHILSLPSHSIHLLQPLDVYTFKYVKTQWRSLLWEFNKSSCNKSLEKPDFVRLFSKLFDYALLPAHCAPSFAKSRIYPFDPRIIPKEKLINSKADSSPTMTNSNSLPRSLSIEFEESFRSDCSASNTGTTVQRKTCLNVHQLQIYIRVIII